MHLHGMLARRDVQVQAEWTETLGTITFTPWGRCTMTAEGSTLTVRIDATDDAGLRQIQDVVTRDFDRFSQRDPLTVAWHSSDTPAAAFPDGATPAPAPALRRSTAAGVRANLQTVVLALAVLAVVAAHVGLAGAIVANSRWTGLAANAVLALVALKVVLIVLGRFGIRRRKHRTAPTAPTALDETPTGDRT
jgi:hypothetical protein